MDTQETKDLLTLSMIPGLGSTHIQRLLAFFGSAGAVLNASHAELSQVAGVSPGMVNTILEMKSNVAVEEEWKEVEKHGCFFLSLSDPNYPSTLKNIYDPPPLLWIKGTYEEHDQNAIAIVGTRHPGRYGRAVTEQFTRELVNQGFTIVSGLARGVDSIAHRTALECGGRTIAVLGSGLGNIYPQEHTEMTEEIATHGCVFSEFTMASAPLAAHFPQRNRVISGLCLGVLITEAAERSGSLITARCALEQNREVFAVPGDIHAEGSIGPHRLIQQGAALVTTVEDILEALPAYVRPAGIADATVPPEQLPDLNPEEKSVWDILGTSSVHIDTIIQQTGLPAPRVASILVMMELKGSVRQLPGKYFARKWSRGM